MAKINGIDQDKINEIKRQKAIKQKEELKKLRENPSGSVQAEHEHKEDVLDIYANLSEQQKIALKLSYYFNLAKNSLGKLLCRNAGTRRF